MGIGQRKPVELIRYESAKTSAGNWVEAENPVSSFQTWAEVRDVTNSRNYDRGQTALETTKRFTLRFRFDKYPNADWKVRYEGILWTISAIKKVSEKQFYWELTAAKSGDV